jgi:uncharacterized repeat protein (TIGR03803 family)
MKRTLIGIPLILAVLTTASVAAPPQQTTGLSPVDAAAIPANHATSADEKVLLNFRSGRKGGSPSGKLIFDGAGNLYGTTSAGGYFNPNCPNGWCGAVFELTPTFDGKWKEIVLHDFAWGKSGSVPYSGLIFDSSGNLYGTTFEGGRGSCLFRACGVVFELTPTTSGRWQETVLYAFSGRDDGGSPYAGLIFDSAGNLYGTTVLGGSHGLGVVFELLPTSSGTWKEKVLHSFTGGKDGSQPSGGLIFDNTGNLYGDTTRGGYGPGCGGYGCGVVFKLTPTSHGKWRETVLYSFKGAKDGAMPSGSSLIFDSTGSLYGTTGGDAEGCGGYGGCGVVFKLSPTSDGRWKETVLHTFTGGADGALAGPALTLDSTGNVYGTAYNGGISNCAYGCGVAFKLTSTSNGEWNESVLHSFTGGNDGGNPASGLIFDSKGSLYGSTTTGGTDGWGGIFELSP